MDSTAAEPNHQLVPRRDTCCFRRSLLFLSLAFISFFSFPCLVGFVSVSFQNLWIVNPISVPSQCKIISSSVDLRSSKVCKLGLLNYKANYVLYPFERKKFRCRYDYYWASVFKVAYSDHSGETRFALAEAPNEALPVDCRPNFEAAWTTRDIFEVNKTYDCWYTIGISNVNLNADNFFNCQAEGPSIFEMLKRYSILSMQILLSWFSGRGRSEYWKWEVIAGALTGFLTSLISVGLIGIVPLLKARLSKLGLRPRDFFAAQSKRAFLFVAYFSLAGWLLIQYLKMLGFPNVLDRVL
ncbi:uncharacterized protein LOC124910217 [Impatiens glandulifera]|uniref:uncharacterized protein LOC124910217 n=1 Tax=Impatiens glandulifera TaxID=253017 RepID=UPI001FB163BB|nr:uncharacterized protein LOC124910217 [Impatiens glandulifera]